jgi:Flp pilus assembly protein TadG
MIVPNTTSHQNSQRGMVLMTMAITAIAMIGAMGLAIDVGHIFIVKNETQAYVDAAAIAAALEMDGTTAGITRANNAATNMSAAWNFSSTVLTSPTVEFASAPTGATWYAAANVDSTLAPTMTYTRVTKTVAPHIYFVPVVMTNKIYSTNVQSRAIAGQVVLAANTSIIEGLGPFTGIAACTHGFTMVQCEGTASNNFGLTVGAEYDIQWPQYNKNRQGCNNGNPTSGNENTCFVSPPCAGDRALMATGTDPMQEVIQQWGASTNGYWGSQSTSQINKYILDQKQLASVAIGTDITQDLSAGNKQGTSKILDDRVNEDTVNFDVSGIGASSSQKLADYLNSANQNPVHNGRRMLPVPIVYPDVGENMSPVVGYGVYLLETNQTTAGGTSTYYKDGNGNDPYCAIYAGPWNMGSTNGGVSSSGGATRVRLVQ